MKKRRVLLFGAFDLAAGYPRARSLTQALEHHGVEVCHVQETLLPQRGERARTLARPWRWPGAGLRLWAGGRRLRAALQRRIREQDYDAVIVPYPGWFSVRDARAIFDGPVLLDLFVSLRNTAIQDRAMFGSGGPVDRLLGWLDRRACEAADRVFLDTPEHADLVADGTGLPREGFDFVPIGDPDAPVGTVPVPALRPGEPLRVLYVGTGVPLHGVSTILSACARTAGIRLSFVGGTEKQRREARALGPGKVEIVVPWVDQPALRRLLDLHHVVFGVFGEGEKAQRVLPFKLVHAMAHGRTVVTAETSAAQTLLVPGDDCLTAPAANPAALARVLSGILDGPRVLDLVGPRARRRYDLTFSPAAIGRRLLLILEDVTGSRWLEADAAAPAPASPSLVREPAAASAGATAR